MTSTGKWICADGVESDPLKDFTGDLTPNTGYQTEKTDSIGEKSGGQQQGATNPQDQPFKQFNGRNMSLGECALHSSQCRKSLCTQKKGAENGSNNDHRNGRQRPDNAADLDQNVDFHQRHGEKKQKQNFKHKAEASGVSNNSDYYIKEKIG